MKALIKQYVSVDPCIKEGDDIIFKYDYDGASLIFPLEDTLANFGNDKKLIRENNIRMDYYRKNYLSNKKDTYHLNNKIVKGKFSSFSRINYGVPIIEIDTDLHKMRDDKIDEILS